MGICHSWRHSARRGLQAHESQLQDPGCTNDNLCEDVGDLGMGGCVNQASEGAVSDTCSEEGDAF